MENLVEKHPSMYKEHKTKSQINREHKYGQGMEEWKTPSSVSLGIHHTSKSSKIKMNYMPSRRTSSSSFKYVLKWRFLEAFFFNGGFFFYHWAYSLSHSIGLKVLKISIVGHLDIHIALLIQWHLNPGTMLGWLMKNFFSPRQLFP